MSEEMSSLMKIILGLVVLVAVVVGISLLFKNSILSFFKGLGGNSTASGVFLPLLK
jgi:hypothetical protein